MKPNSIIYTVLLAGLLLPLMFSCKKEDIKVIPIITISAVSEITATTITSILSISTDGGTPITTRGICWSTNQDPTISDNKTTNGAGMSSFTSTITGLIPGTIYNIRAYATNSVGISYSSQTTLTTLTSAPILATSELTAVTSTSATGGGNISSDGGSSVTARGVCWSKSQNPTVADLKTSNGTGTGIFTSPITGLTPGVTYYIRAYATNSTETAYKKVNANKSKFPSIEYLFPILLKH